MYIPRFFYAGDLVIDTTILLPAISSHHLLNVLRVTVGETVIIFNGRGGEYEGQFIERYHQQARIKIITYRDRQTESALFIEVGQALSRSEKMDYAIQKAVELGAKRITPLITERCAIKLKNDRKENRMAHWQKIVIAACEQSGRCTIPEICAPVLLSSWLAIQREGLSLVCDPHTSSSLVTPNKPTQVTLLIGPESGLSDNEISLAKKSGFIGFSLGPRILRTETATVVALSLVQREFGDLKNSF